MPDNLRMLWLRVVADSRTELERLCQERPDLGLDRDLDALFATLRIAVQPRSGRPWVVTEVVKRSDSRVVVLDSGRT